jgi:hypothetical protein
MGEELADDLIVAARALDSPKAPLPNWPTAQSVASTRAKCCSPDCRDGAGHGDRGNFCPEHGELLARIRDDLNGKPRKRGLFYEWS